MERHVPSKDEVLAYLKEDRNWGRWGNDDQMGAMNMITPEKRCLLYTSPSPRDLSTSRMPSSA